MLNVSYTEDALRDLRRIGRVAAVRVMEKVAAYAAKPSAFTNRVKRLKGSGYLRLRVGDYRVVWVIHIGHRREVYR